VFNKILQIVAHHSVQALEQWRERMELQQQERVSRRERAGAWAAEHNHHQLMQRSRALTASPTQLQRRF